MKRSFLKLTYVALGLMATALLPFSSQACDKGGPDGKGGEGRGPKKERAELTPEQREEMKQKRLDAMAEKLGLDESQKDQVAKVFAEQHEKAKAIFEDESLSREEKGKELKALHEETKQQLDGILTDEQKEKLATLRPPRGPHGPGPRGEGKGPRPDKTKEKPAEESGSTGEVPEPATT